MMMDNWIRAPLAAAGFAAFLAMSASQAEAALISSPEPPNTFPGTDCGGTGGFDNCYATAEGTNQGGPGSPTIYKIEVEGGTDGGNYPSIDGDEFDVTFNSATHVLSWTYDPTAPDPDIFFFTIKQGNEYVLFYDDEFAPLLSASVDLDDYNWNPDSWSHITFFNAQNDIPPDPNNPVPEPGVLGLMGLGLLGLGLTAYSRRRRGA